jgi:GNS1/SUR4 family
MSLDKIPLPTLDRPFGVELWPIFVKAYSAVMGYSPTDFKFVPGVTPISTLKETAIILGAYYAVVLGGREIMRNRKPFVINAPFMVHNFSLTAISAILLALFIEQLVPTVFRNGIFFAICDHKGGWTKELVTLYYVWTPNVPYADGLLTMCS